MKIKKKFLSLFLFFFMMLGVVLPNDIVYGASPYTWANTPTITLNNNSYYKITDMTTYGKNYTTYGTYYHYNSYYKTASSRVTYFKKVLATYGQQLRFITSDSDIASGSANTSSSRNILYSLTEYDASGNPLYETNWRAMNTTWTVGQTADGITISGSRSNVAYVVFIFKWIDGYTGLGGSNTIAITPAQVASDVKNLYIVKGSSLNYTLSYNANGGSCSTSSKTITYGSTYGSLPTPARTGYTFKGWYTAASGGSKVTSSTAMNKASNHTLYAQWSHNKYTVTYNANGGSTTEGQKTLYYNDAIDLSPVAEMPGKIFVGWSTKPNTKKSLSSLKMPDLATSLNSDYSKDWELTLYAVYSIPVSDVSNHTYPEYEKVNEEEVFFQVWEVGNEDNYKIYPLTYQKDVNTMEYRYVLPSTDISSFVSGMSTYGYQILAYDNAGNHRILYTGSSSGAVVTPPKQPEKYTQIVNHYRYDAILNDWVKYDTTTEDILEKLTYTPQFITPPVGYKTDSITYPDGYEISSDGSYVVTESATSSAYYMPMDYTLIFDATGGTCEITEKSIIYGGYYGFLPTPTKTGYTFLGWYTEENAGELVLPSHKYLTADDTTVYAHWRVNDYKVTYDYWTNGGTDSTVKEESVSYGSPIDVSITAVKESEDLKDWRFVGWNTDPDAKTGLENLVMADENVTLYAIFDKNITVTIVEQTDSGTNTRTLDKTIYNRETDATFIMEQVNEWTDWIFLGWTTEIGAEEAPVVGVGGLYKTTDSITLYGLYTSTVTLRYDTNGSSMVIEDQTKERYYNAFGDGAYPSFIIVDGPILSQHSFVNWKDSLGNEYIPGTDDIFEKDTVLRAEWDKYPEIEAYNRYFTLEQAQNGTITETELLKKVVGTDLEDGILVKGVDVIVKGYKASDFTALDTDAEIEITYQATDSFGNAITKTITAKVTDTTTKKSTKKSYVRFISSKFFIDSKGNLISESEGGLEENSIWRTDSKYFSLLERALSNSDENTESRIEETWIFKQEDIKTMKEKLKSNLHN